MSAYLLNAVLAQQRTLFAKADVATVDAYGGEFSGGEIGQLGFNCPALLTTVLGWAPEDGGSGRLIGRLTRRVRMATFVVTKHPKRDARMAQAMALAEVLATGLRLWVPDSTGLPVSLAGLDHDATCENMYGRLVDAKGLALWMVSWTQLVKPSVPLPQLYDLLAIDITDHTHQGGTPEDAAAPAAAPLVVTEDVLFEPVPPAA